MTIKNGPMDRADAFLYSPANLLGKAVPREMQKVESDQTTFLSRIGRD
jgi:hypothetical protein